MLSDRTKLGIFIDWYLPAYKAGGPIQSITNLVGQLKEEYDISIITSNTDLDEILNLNKNQLNTWILHDGYRIIYLDSQHQRISFYKKLLKENAFDVVYFNSLFSLKFTLFPLWLLRNSSIRKVLATRGMLGKGALAIKSSKKKVFLQLFKLMKLHKKLIWHATAQNEVDEIETHFGPAITIILAPNLSSIRQNEFTIKLKEKNCIRIFFLSRIAIKKNLFGALDVLSKIKSIHKITFTLIGPIDDKAYWKKCLIKIKTLPKNVKVNYVGAIPNHELPNHLVNEHLLFLPTYGENFGHVIVESWQNSCPVIISDLTPWRNLESKMLGYDIAIENQDAFVHAIEHLSAMSEEEYSLWSKSAFNFAKSFIENPAVLEQNKTLFL